MEVVVDSVEIIDYKDKEVQEPVDMTGFQPTTEDTPW